MLLALLVPGALQSEAKAGVTSLRLRGEPGAGLVAGTELFFIPADGTFTAGQSSSSSVSISFNTPTFSHNFNLNFGAPQGQQLVVGSYTGATRFSSPDHPGLNVFGDGVGCNTVSGSFEIKQASYGAGGQLNAFWATFEQHCDGVLPALFGEIRFNADVPVVLSAPATAAVVEGAQLSLVVRAVDLQNRHVTLTTSNAPPGATFVDKGDNTGALLWTPSVGQGGAYVVAFHGENGAGSSDDASTRITVMIPGDDFGNAAPISALPYTNSLDIIAATSATDDPNPCFFPAHTVWYVFSPIERTRVEANTFGSDFDTGLAVFTGSRGSLLHVVCNDDASGPASEVVFDAMAGQNYYFMVGPAGGGPGGNLVFSVNRLVPPPNDDFGAATRVTALPYSDRLDTTGAIVASDDPLFCASGGHTVWYAFTPTNHLRVEVSTLGSDYDTVLSVLTGPRGAMTLVTCGASSGGQPSTATFEAQAGRTYYLLIAAYDDRPGGMLQFTMNALVPPPNDDFDQATPLGSLPYVDTLNTSLATTNLDDPVSCTRLGATVWYTFVPAEDLFIQASTAGSDYSAMMVVYQGSRTALQPVACFGGDTIGVPLNAGVRYFFLVGTSFGGNGGHLRFTMQGRPRLKITVSVDEVGSVDTKIGSATLQGTVASSRPVTIYLSGLLRQAVGRFHVISAEFGQGSFPNSPSLALFCAGQCQWSARVFSPDGSFGGGAAFVELLASAYEASESASAQTSATMHLSGSAHLSLDPEQPQLLSARKSTSGTILLEGLLVMGKTNIIEATTDLHTWSPVGMLVPKSNPCEWPDLDSPGRPQRFYRVLTGP